jgi:hypothetical protein
LLSTALAHAENISDAAKWIGYSKADGRIVHAEA